MLEPWHVSKSEISMAHVAFDQTFSVWIMW